MNNITGRHFLSLLLLFGFLYGCGGNEKQRPENQKVLLISFDGLTNDFIDRNSTPNFDRFIKNGVKAEHLIPVFPTKTFPNHYSQVTGLYVENHGIISNSFPDYSLDGEFNYGPQDSPNDERWWGGEPIWATVENQGKTAATMFWPGSEASIHGVQPTRWKEYDGSVENFARIDSVVSWLDETGEVNADFATLYFSDIDNSGHAYGPSSSAVDEAVIEADSLLGYLWNEISIRGLEDRLNVIIVSDHGMAELSDEKVIFLDDMIDMIDVEMIDWTPVAMLRPDSGKMQEVYQTLKENEKNYRVYLKEDLPQEFGFTNHHRIPGIIMIADVPYLITSRSFFEGREMMSGAHGYDHRSPEMAAVFYARGPVFKQGDKVTAFSAIHLYELMAHLLDIKPAMNDGNLDSVKSVLR